MHGWTDGCDVLLGMRKIVLQSAAVAAAGKHTQINVSRHLQIRYGFLEVLNLLNISRISGDPPVCPASGRAESHIK